jgi:hypothetical protein
MTTTTFHISPTGHRHVTIMNRAAKLKLRFDATVKAFVTDDAEVAESLRKLGATVMKAA